MKIDTIRKYFVHTMLAFGLALFFAACGGGGDSASFDGNSTGNQIDINVTCTTPATISSYIALVSGDVIVQTGSNTTIETYHDINGDKRVCLVSGSAYILRK